MASCEPRRSSAYSDDIHWRIIWQRHALGYTHNAIHVATNLNVDVSTVRRILDTFSATGTVFKKAYPAERAFRKITEPVQVYIAISDQNVFFIIMSSSGSQPCKNQLVISFLCGDI